MNAVSFDMFGRLRHVCVATAAAALLAVVGLSAQYAVFNAAFEGELWTVRHELIPGGGASTVGVAYVNGTLYVTDGNNGGIIVYDSNGTIIPMPAADWNQTADSSSPAYGLIPNEIAGATVKVNGTDTSAILVSDLDNNRVMAFATADGSHLFTLLLDNPNSAETTVLINGMSMGPGAKFVLTTAGPALTVQGSFAAGWTNDYRTNGAVLAYKNQAFLYDVANARFSATPAAILVGTEGGNLAPHANEPYGVVFDTLGNLYMNDTVTERINVYDANFAHRFTFGTPAPDHTTTQFNQPFGMMFWPDAQVGRLFVADAINNRVEVFRPDLANNTLKYLFTIPIEDDSWPFSVALDPSTGRLAVADASQPRVWVLQTANLAAFDLQVLNSAGDPVESVCAGDSYQVRFSLTVPAGRAAAANVVPQLFIDGVLESQVPVPSDNYPASPMKAGQVATYTYAFAAPAGSTDELVFEAGATSSTTDIRTSHAGLTIANCTAGAPPTITASPNIAPQVSGWTPIFAGDTFSVTLTATDDAGVARIEYQFIGANDQGATIDPIIYSEPWSTSQQITVPFEQMGDTTLRFRVRDSDNRTSAWQELNVRLVGVTDRLSVEADQPSFSVGVPVGAGYTFSATGLPEGISINSSTGLISGMVGWNAAGVHTVVVTETSGALSTSVSFVWTIVNFNRPPVILQPPAFAILEGQPFSLQVVGFDPDGDLSFFTGFGRSIPLGYELPPSITIDTVTGLISGTFPYDSQREYTIQVGLSECATSTPAFTMPSPPCVGDVPGERLASVTSFTVSVANVNRLPFGVNPGPQSNNEGDGPITLPIVASDPDSDPLTYSAVGLPQGLSINATTGVISGTLTYASAGVHAVTVNVSDGIAIPGVPVTFVWTVNNVIKVPVVTAGNRTNAEGNVLANVSVVTVVHPDPAALTFSATGLPAGLVMNPATGTVSGTLGYASAGSYPVTVTVKEGPATATASFTWTVIETNAAPVLTNPGNQTSAGGAVVILPIMASDQDLDTLTYSASGLPQGLSINSTTGVISGTIALSAATSNSVTVTASDGVASDSKTFTWSVTGTNRPPTCVATATPSVIWPPNHRKVYLSLTGVVDPEGGALTIRYTGILQDEPTDSVGQGNTMQDGGIEDNGARAWVRAERTGNPGVPGDGRVYLISFTATDAGALSCTGTVSTAVPHDQSGAPAVLSPGRWNSITGQQVSGFLPPDAVNDAVTVKKGEATTIAVLSNDIANGQTLTVAMVTPPSIGAATVNANGTITYQPPAGTTGATSFTYRVTTPSGGTDTATVTVTIKK